MYFENIFLSQFIEKHCVQTIFTSNSIVKSSYVFLKIIHYRVMYKCTCVKTYNVTFRELRDAIETVLTLNDKIIETLIMQIVEQNII